MEKIFDDNHIIGHILRICADLLWINILTLLCCLPVITIGASLTAMHAQIYHLKHEEDRSITSDFFKTFTSNFKQATLIWIIYLVYGIIISFSIYFIQNRYTVLPTFDFIVIIIVSLIVFCSFNWVFILQFRYQNSVFATIRNSIIISFTNLGHTLAMIGLLLLPIIILLFIPRSEPIIFALGFPLAAYYQAAVYSSVFEKLENKHMKD